MYTNIDMTAFGQKLRAVREGLKIPRKKIEETTGITSESLRLIEKGAVIPRISTLHILSNVYKVDLMVELETINRANPLVLLHDYLDEIILYNDLEGIMDTELDIQKIMHGQALQVIDDIEMDQFASVLGYIKLTYSDLVEDCGQAAHGFKEALRLRHDNFEWQYMHQYLYTFLELRLLFLGGIAFAGQKNYDISSKLFTFVAENLKKSGLSKVHYKKLYLKAICNLSFNEHISNNNSQALRYANMGIVYCVDNDMMYLLETLYFRKAIALYLTGDPTYKEVLAYVAPLLKIQKKKKVLDSYRRACKRIYNLDL